MSNLQQPILILGDFNAHHPLWDINIDNADNQGEQIENLLLNYNYSCLNEENVSTYFSKTHGTFSSVDLSICSSSIIDMFEWHVLDDCFTSDHYPIMINLLSNCPPEQLPKYNFEKANWKKFTKITENIQTFQDDKEHNDINAEFINFLISAANKSIPLISYNGSKKTVPWWSLSLAQKIKLKHRLDRRLKRLNNRLKKIWKDNDFSLHNLVIIVLEIDCIRPMLNRVSALIKREILGRYMYLIFLKQIHKKNYGRNSEK